jgi:hypothetical protein
MTPIGNMIAQKAKSKRYWRNLKSLRSHKRQIWLDSQMSFLLKGITRYLIRTQAIVDSFQCWINSHLIILNLRLEPKDNKLFFRRNHCLLFKDKHQRLSFNNKSKLPTQFWMQFYKSQTSMMIVVGVGSVRNHPMELKEVDSNRVWNQTELVVDIKGVSMERK